MRGKVLAFGALLMALLPQVALTEANDTQIADTKIVEKVVANDVVGQKLFNSACEAYFNAKISASDIEGSKYYAKAIGDIAKATAIEPNNSDYLLVASQIWRSKGGLSYAKSYFAKAEASLTEKLMLDSEDIGANLDYAIACYAGDVRYWSNYSNYKDKAREYAQKAIALCEKELENGNKSNLLRVMALANLVLEKQDKCLELLRKAKEEDSKSDWFSLFKLFEDEESTEHKTANIFYCDLYENTVDKGMWFWQVDKKNADKEFLLYYLTDEARNNNL